MIHNPERFIAGPLRWTSTGAVLATWVLTKPLPIARNQDDAANNMVISRSLWEAIAGRRYWLESLVCWMSPTALANAMLAEGRDQHPQWLNTVDDAISYFDEDWLGARRYLLTVELPTNLQDGIRSAGKSAANVVLQAAGVNPLTPTPEEYQAALARMDTISEQLPEEYNAVPATPEIMAWARRHHIRREGEDLTELLTHSDLDLLGGEVESAGRLEWAGLDQSGMASMSKRDKITAPWRNQWVAVTDEDGNTTYQAHLILRSVPRSMQWPSMEILGRIDDAGVQVDYTITGVARPRAEALSKNAKAMDKLNAQVDQVEGASAGAQSTHMARLRSAANVLAGYNEDFSDDEHLVEHEPVIIAAFSAYTPEDLNKSVSAFKRANTNLSWARPVGAEDIAFIARQPGGDLPVEINAYRQVTHSVTMASMAAVTSSRLGHDTGLPLWIDQTSTLRRLALWEPWGEGDEFKQRAAAMATIGKQGSGKTYFAFTTAGLMVDSGARFVATDTTAEREWSVFADSLDTTVSKVDFEIPTASVDPLRCLPLKQAAEVTGPFLSTLLNLDSDSPERLALTEVLAPKFLAEHHIESLPDLLGKVTKAKRLGAKDLADRLELWIDKDRFPALFDLSLPPVDNTNQCLIWGTYGLEIPTTEEISKEHLFRKMSDGKRMGRALSSLFSWWSKSVCWDPTEAAFLNIDEFHHILISPEATLAQLQLVREMRHAFCGVHYQTQLNEYPSELLGLIGTRLVLNVDRGNLSSSADFLLDENATDEDREAVKSLIATHNSRGRGAGVLRMQRGAETQIGKVQTVQPFTQARQKAASTSSARIPTKH